MAEIGRFGLANGGAEVRLALRASPRPALLLSVRGGTAPRVVYQWVRPLAISAPTTIGPITSSSACGPATSHALSSRIASNVSSQP